LKRRGAERAGQPVPCESIDEYRRIKDLLPDDQIDHLALRELPAVIFDESPDFNYGFHNHTDIEFTAAE
jgi:hypothetical protein